MFPLYYIGTSWSAKPSAWQHRKGISLCRAKYDTVITDLKIRPLRIQAGRGVVVRATEEGLVVDTEARQAGSAEENV